MLIFGEFILVQLVLCHTIRMLLYVFAFSTVGIMSHYMLLYVFAYQ